jgi:hypothetical protein
MRVDMTTIEAVTGAHLHLAPSKRTIMYSAVSYFKIKGLLHSSLPDWPSPGFEHYRQNESKERKSDGVVLVAGVFSAQRPLVPGGRRIDSYNKKKAENKKGERQKRRR